MNKPQLFLGIDGGQSHTEAVVADEHGNILGRGIGGASNHAEQPGGRERLHKAILESVGAALKNARLSINSDAFFVSAHCAMTGGADYKEEIIRSIFKAGKLIVAHDAPAALFGATAGKPGIVVIAGTGSVVYAENENGENLTVGGWGHLFGDQGSGFWLTMELIKLEIDYFTRTGLMTERGKELLKFFSCQNLREFVLKVYGEEISRDRIAAFSQKIHEWADSKQKEIAKILIGSCAKELATLVAIAANRVMFSSDLIIAPVGGNFRGEHLKASFTEWLKRPLPEAVIIEPQFNPAIGALLLAYREADVAITNNILTNLPKQTA